MKTCCICGQGYKSPNEDILVYGCASCQKGEIQGRRETLKLEKVISSYKKKTSSDMKLILA